MKIAVIGAGLAGLTAAWLLGRRTGWAVTLLESRQAPGFTASAVSLPPGEFPPGARVDVPLRVFYPGYYPTLTRLYAELGVSSEAVSYASTFLDAAGEPYFRYVNVRVGANSWSVPAWSGLGSRRAWAIAAGAWRFARRARAAQAHGALAGLTVAEFAGRERLGADFVEGLLLPAICTVCTCPSALARELPAALAADYLLRGLTREPVRRARFGADDVQARLLAGLGTVRTGCPVQAVRREGAGVRVQADSAGGEYFDHVVFATPAPQAARMLADASPGEAAVLAGFRTTPVEVVTHRDASFLPATRRHWSSVTLRVDPAQEGPESTIWLNAVQPALRGAPDVFQTVSPHRTPAPGRVLGHARFERPVVDARSEAALQALGRLHVEPARRVWFCGAWAQPGVPLLESAVRSAATVAERLGAPML